MRALRYHTVGSPADVLRLDELATPDPGWGEVRVRLTHRTINPADLITIRGRYGARPELPAVGGNEGVGVVDALGEGVHHLELGQRVVPLGVAPSWQEAIIAPPEALVPVPDGVSDEAAAQLYVNPLTAWLLLEHAGPFQDGDVLVQTAGASAVARCVTQLAVRRGLRIVSLVRSDAYLDELRALGTEILVTDGTQPNALEQLQALIEDDGAAAGFDSVMGPAGLLVLGALRPGATHIVYGGLSGKPLAVDAGALIYRAITVRGLWRTRWAETTPLQDVRAAVAALADLVAQDGLDLPVEATYDLADYAEAVEHAAPSGRWGKVLLTG